MGSLSRALSLSLSLSLSRRQGLPRDLLKICFTRSLSREARRYMRTRGKIGQKKKNLSTSTSSVNGDEKKSFRKYIPLFGVFLNIYPCFERIRSCCVCVRVPPCESKQKMLRSTIKP